jgi:hypothetical protein
MLLTMPLASDEGDHLPATFDAVFIRDSIGVTVPFNFLPEWAINRDRTFSWLLIPYY